MASLYYLSGMIFIINIIKIFQLCSVFLESWTICQQLQHSHPFPSGIHQHVEQQWQHEDLPGQSQTMCAVGPCDLWTHSSSQQGQTTEEFFRYCSLSFVPGRFGSCFTWRRAQHQFLNVWDLNRFYILEYRLIPDHFFNLKPKSVSP